MSARRKVSSGIAYFKRKVSALHTEMFIRLMKDREIDPASLSELLEDLANQFLDLSDEIRCRILASRRSAGRAEPFRSAGGPRR